MDGLKTPKDAEVFLNSTKILLYPTSFQQEVFNMVLILQISLNLPVRCDCRWDHNPPLICHAERQKFYGMAAGWEGMSPVTSGSDSWSYPDRIVCSCCWGSATYQNLVLTNLLKPWVQIPHSWSRHYISLFKICFRCRPGHLLLLFFFLTYSQAPLTCCWPPACPQLTFCYWLVHEFHQVQYCVFIAVDSAAPCS